MSVHGQLQNAKVHHRVTLWVALVVWSAGCRGQIAIPTLTPCQFTLSSDNRVYAHFGGLGSVTISTPTHCTWTASSNADWLIVSNGSNGQGNGTVIYHVEENPIASSREALIEVVDAKGQGESVHHKVSQAASTRMPFRGVYTFMMETDPDGVCAWPVTKFYWLVSVKITSFMQDTALGSITFPQTPISPSSMWNISSSLTKTELVPSQDSPGPAGGEYDLIVEGGIWEAGGFVVTRDNKEQIVDGTASGATQILTLRDTNQSWECQSDVKWSLLIRYSDED
jgi:hypothetical protein